MMKLTHKRLATFCSLIAALVPECRLMITKDGLNTLAVDTANVGMVSVRLPATAFEQFTVTDAEVGMDVGKWKGAVTIMEKADTIEIVQDNGKIQFSDGSYTYTHNPLDPTTLRKRPTPPAITLPATVVMNSKDLAEHLKAMGIVADRVRFIAENETLRLEAEGDTDHIRKVIEHKDGSKFPAGKISSLFSLEYLKEIGKAMKDAGDITLHLGDNHPIRFDFDIEEMEVSYLLAPRIEGD